MITARRRYWVLAVRHDRAFFSEFGSFVRGEAIAKISERRRKGIRRIDLKIIASDPGPAAVTTAVEALIDTVIGRWLRRRDL
jgi:hypothetical protein